jgi:hypothetical protein
VQGFEKYAWDFLGTVDPALAGTQHPFAGPGVHVAQALTDWYHVRRVGDELARSGVYPAVFASVGERDEVVKFLNELLDERVRDQFLSLAIGVRAAEYALHNYHMTNDLDAILRWFIPWHFWTTRTAIKYVERALDRPYVFSQLDRVFDDIELISEKLSDDELPDRVKERIKGKIRSGVIDGLFERLTGVKGLKTAVDYRRLFFPVDMFFFSGPLDRPDRIGPGPRNSLGNFLTAVQQFTGGLNPILQMALYYSDLTSSESYARYLRERGGHETMTLPGLNLYLRIIPQALRLMGFDLPLPMEQTTLRDVRVAQSIIAGWILEGKLTPDEGRAEMLKLRRAWDQQSAWSGFGIFGKVNVDGHARLALEQARRVNLTGSDGIGSLTGINVQSVLPLDVIRGRLEQVLNPKEVQDAIMGQFGKQLSDRLIYQLPGDFIIDQDAHGRPITRKLTAQELSRLVMQKALKEAEERPWDIASIAKRERMAAKALEPFDTSDRADREVWQRYFATFSADDPAERIASQLAISEFFKGMAEAKEQHLTRPLANHTGLFGHDAVERSRIEREWYDVIRPQVEARLRAELREKYGVEVQVPSGIDSWQEFYAQKIRTALDPEHFRDQDGVINWQARSATERAFLDKIVPPEMRAEVVRELERSKSVQDLAREAIAEQMKDIRESYLMASRLKDGPEKTALLERLERAYTERLSMWSVVNLIHDRRPDWTPGTIAVRLMTGQDDPDLAKELDASPDRLREYLTNKPLAEVASLKDYMAVFDAERVEKLLNGVYDRIRLPNGTVVETGRPWTDADGVTHHPKSNLAEFLRAREFRNEFFRDIDGKTSKERLDILHRYFSYDDRAIDYEYFYGGGPVAAAIRKELAAIDREVDKIFQEHQRGTPYPKGTLDLIHRQQALREALDAARDPEKYLTALLSVNQKAIEWLPKENPGTKVLTTSRGVELERTQVPTDERRAALAEAGKRVAIEYRLNIDPDTGEVRVLRDPRIREQGREFIGSSGTGERIGFEPRPGSGIPRVGTEVVRDGVRYYAVEDPRGMTHYLPGRMSQHPGESVTGLLSSRFASADWVDVLDYVMTLYGFPIPDRLKSDPAAVQLRWDAFNREWPEIAAIVNLAADRYANASLISDPILREAMLNHIRRSLVDGIREKEGLPPIYGKEPPPAVPNGPSDPESLPDRLSVRFVTRNSWSAVRDQIQSALGYPNPANYQSESLLSARDRRELAREVAAAFNAAYPWLIPYLQDVGRAWNGAGPQERVWMATSLINVIYDHLGLPRIDTLPADGSIPFRFRYANEPVMPARLVWEFLDDLLASESRAPFIPRPVYITGPIAGIDLGTRTSGRSSGSRRSSRGGSSSSIGVLATSLRNLGTRITSTTRRTGTSSRPSTSSRRR